MRTPNIFEVMLFEYHHGEFKHFYDTTLSRKDLINFKNQETHTIKLFEFSEETQIAELIMKTNTKTAGVLEYKAYLKKLPNGAVKVVYNKKDNNEKLI